MDQVNRQKIKLLKLYEYLKHESDEDYPITTKEVIAFLASEGITCDRRTLYKDIEDLNDFGYEIMKRQVGKESGYYVADRSFIYAELKILVDAVLAASFITEKKTIELIEKIASLGGIHQAKLLKGSQVAFKTNKRHNEQIYYVIEQLEFALRQNKQVSFQYFDLNEHREKVLRKQGQHYVVQPVALIFHEDNYYLISYDNDRHSTTTYRVDRMHMVDVTQHKISMEAKEVRQKLKGYTERVFKMYAGNLETVTLSFNDHLMNAIYDKFGETIKIKRLKDGQCEVSVPIQVSTVFFGWLFQFGSEMKIQSPKSVVDQYKQHVDLVYNSLKSR